MLCDRLIIMKETQKSEIILQSGGAKMRNKTLSCLVLERIFKTEHVLS